MLTPNTDWGGEGSLGCGIGYGYLHRIPYKKERKPEDPEVGKPEKVEGVLPPPPPSTASGTPGEGYADVSTLPLM